MNALREAYRKIFGCEPGPLSNEDLMNAVAAGFNIDELSEMLARQCLAEINAQSRVAPSDVANFARHEISDQLSRGCRRAAAIRGEQGE